VDSGRGDYGMAVECVVVMILTIHFTVSVLP
jgi:hypothetical protein